MKGPSSPEFSNLKVSFCGTIACTMMVKDEKNNKARRKDVLGREREAIVVDDILLYLSDLFYI